MKGLVVKGGGLRLSDDLPAPTPIEGQVLVRVHAAGLNPTDVDIASGAVNKLLDASLLSAPVRTGLEFAGVVVGGGAAVEAGTSVFAYPHVMGPQKGHQEHVVVDEGCIAPMPASLDFAQAASLPLAATTVLVLHRDVAPIARGERVLIIGAAGGVGLAHVQIARHVHGADVTAVAGPGNEALLSSMGAGRVLDYQQTALSDLMETFDLVVDWTTTYRFADVAHLLAPDGLFVPADPFKNSEDFEEGSPAAARSGYLLAVQATRADLTTVAEWVEAGLLQPMVDSEFALGDYPRALERLAQRAKRGRVVLRMAAEMHATPAS